jgi:hypothetical protein
LDPKILQLETYLSAVLDFKGDVLRKLGGVSTNVLHDRPKLLKTALLFLDLDHLVNSVDRWLFFKLVVSSEIKRNDDSSILVHISELDPNKVSWATHT